MIMDDTSWYGNQDLVADSQQEMLSLGSYTTLRQQQMVVRPQLQYKPDKLHTTELVITYILGGYMQIDTLALPRCLFAQSPMYV